ncbi:uncharacterized protein LOC117814274 [Notolabrus celidotus]|uniref:uncharacterized protein LOC117814274 n=1 Tax=Notolabrus celidotus TaxID=1203425 RepID=UPI00148F882B|nr:uncharacterized protein LOC117814274 [Notolabrus celidotus]
MDSAELLKESWSGSSGDPAGPLQTRRDRVFRPGEKSRRDRVFRPEEKSRRDRVFRPEEKSRRDRVFRPGEKSRRDCVFRPEEKSRRDRVFRPEEKSRRDRVFRPGEKSRRDRVFRPGEKSRRDRVFRPGEKSRRDRVFRPEEKRHSASRYLRLPGCMMGSFRRPRPRFMSSPVLSDLARFHASSPALQLSNTSVWNSVQSAVIKVFQGGALQTNELFTLNESIRWLLKTEMGSFITDYFQNQLLTRGLSEVLDQILVHSGESR